MDYQAIIDKYYPADDELRRVLLQHGSLLQKLHVDGQFLVFPDNLQATVSHLSAMIQ